MDDILAVLKAVQWECVAKTFGSSHSTLIGAIVQSWNSSAVHRFALEGGCSREEGAYGFPTSAMRFCAKGITSSQDLSGL